MSITGKFETLVRELDQETLEELRQSVSSEIDGRGETLKVEDIRPGMSATEKERVTKEIARVLKDLYA
jgi:hypothetical protein